MATQVQNRRGTTAEHSTFTGANGELTVDTTKRTLVVHDGATAGGRPLLREDQSNLPTSAPTTGIYNASGSLAISTGGSGRLFVDASGRVGIGASPGFPLEVRATSSTGQVQILGSDNTNATWRLATPSSSVVAFGGATTHAVAFGGFDNTTQAFSERLRITSAGLVGVGTSSPGGRLQSSSAAAEVAFMASSATADPQYPSFGFAGQVGSNGGRGTGMYLAADNTLAFSTLGAERVCVDGIGRVGIGDSLPDSTVTIKAAAATTPLKVSGPSSEFLRCDQQGRLLVGTSSDSGGALFQVNGDRIRVGTAKTPASATDTGTAGEICWDASYVYVCTATNTWKRSALSTW